jgi:hypothetical protein
VLTTTVVHDVPDAGRGVLPPDIRGRLASAADVMGGLQHAADAATGRLAARRRSLAAC